jgi:hypothetical protein
LRSAPRLGLAGVPNALSFELNLLILLGVALVIASWRVVLHCRRRNAPSALRLAYCAREFAVLYRSWGNTPNPLPPLRSAEPLRMALLCA